MNGPAADAVAHPAGAPPGDGEEEAFQEHERVLVVCVDGTWCADSTDTTTNVEIVAKSFANATFAPRGKKPGYGQFSVVSEPDEPGRPAREHKEFLNLQTNVMVGYFNGIGLGGEGGEYLFNGALALDIMDHCVDSYKFIVDNYEPGRRILMFGLSRGAYIIRCVAGMIHNCGILKRQAALQREASRRRRADEAPLQGRDDVDRLIRSMCKDVYRMYVSEDKGYHPESPDMVAFRASHSHTTSVPPILYMGLFDTVAAVGLPSVNEGFKAGYGYTLHDQVVSEQVQIVCQALAAGDRLANFEPVFVRRKPKLVPPVGADGGAVPPAGADGGAVPPAGADGGAAAQQDSRGVSRYPANTRFEAHEVWFPGSHYDIGRQRFIFLRNARAPYIEQGLHWLMKYARFGINYTPALSNPPCVWLLDQAKAAVRQHLGFNPLPEGAATYIRRYNEDTWVPPRPLTFIHGLPLVGKYVPYEPFTIDAYDGGFEMLWGVIQWIPFVDSVAVYVRLLLNLQVLADRFIPHYNVSDWPTPADPAASDNRNMITTSMKFYKNGATSDEDAPKEFKQRIDDPTIPYRAQTYVSFVRRGGVAMFTPIVEVPLTPEGLTQPL